MRLALLLLFVFVSLPATSAAQQATAADIGAGTGVSGAQLARIDSLMRLYVDDGRVAGVVTAAWQGGHVIQHGAWGLADREAGRAMTEETLFRIASQSKAITSVAVMMLVEEGKLRLGERVSRWVPGFSNMRVATASDSGTVLEPARREITIRDLLTHLSGLSYGVDPQVRDQYAAAGLGPAAGWGWYFADKAEPICTSIDRLASLPLVSQPGEEWVYGYSSDVLGCVIERVSGVPFDRFLSERIFQPLGMKSTWFFVPRDEAGRLAVVYAAEGSGIVRAPDNARGQGHYVDGPRTSFSGGAGLVSTAGDYVRFLQMMLNGGELDGQRILSPATVELMTRDHVGDRYGQDGMGFGLGFQILEDAGVAGTYGADGVFSWGGAYGSTYWVDPENNLVAVFMIQLLPSGGLDLSSKYRTMLHSALLQ